MRKHALIPIVLGILAPSVAFGFIQERTPTAVPIRWNLSASQPNINNGMVEYVINKRGSEDTGFTAVVPAVEAAFATWRNDAGGSVIDFVRLADPSTLSEGTKPNKADQVNVVYWDEDPRNAYMVPVFSFAVVVRDVNGTTGELRDADIVLNGFQYLWTTQADGNFKSKTGPADIQEALTKAVGEFIGLNVVPTMGSVLQETDYPGNTSRRSLTQDELAAALDIYPPTPNPAVTSISGIVTRSGIGVFGVYVAAFQNGVPVVGAITDQGGNYSIRRLPAVAASYTVRALTARRPSAISSPFYSMLDNDLLSEAYLNAAIDPATTVTTVPGADVPLINLEVAAAGTADPWEPDNDQANAKTIATDSSRQIHHTFPAVDTDVVKFSATAGRLYAIETSNLGSGVGDSDTIITLRNPSFTPIASNDDRNLKQRSRGSRIAFRASVSGMHFVEIVQKVAGVAGSGTAYDIAVTDLGTAAPTPTVSSVTPAQGSQGGGYQVSISGSNFLPGASVSFGGLAGTEVDVVSSTKLFVTVPSTGTPGPVNITVTNLGGAASAPLAGGFTYLGDVTTVGTYFDATFAAFGTFPGGDSDAVAWTDYDADRDLDIYFTTDLAGQLWRNNGNATFTNVTAASGITAGDPANPESAAWGDYNNDGCIDVYKVNLVVTANKRLLRNNCDGTFTDVTATAGVAGRTNGRSRDAAWADYNNDGWLDLFVAYDDLAGPNQLFRNRQDGTFTEVASTAGVNNTGSGFNCNWADFNRDGWPDLFLVRSGAQSDILYKNNADGTFSDVTVSAGITDTAQGADAVWGDFNNDGWPDLYVVGLTGINHLFQNDLDGTFTDVSVVSGTNDTFGAARGAAVADFDSDGRLDIFVAQAFDGRTDSQIDFLFHNDGGGTPAFSDSTFNSGVDDPFNGLSAAFGDYTGNGAADLFVGNAGSGNDVLWENQANRNNSLVVQLVGTISNRLGIGARVVVTADLDGAGPMPAVTQTKEMIGGSKGQNPVELHFGLGRANVENLQVDALTVFWPASALTQMFLDGLAPNQVLTIFEGAPGVSITRVSPSSGPTAGGTTVVITGMNFEPDATVKFGGLSATVLPPVLGNRITATTPAHAAGAVDVTVTNPSRSVGDPLREGVLPNGFVYVSGDPLDSLECFDPVNTTCVWANVPGAAAYDVIRGNISSLQIVGGTQVSLGSVVCIENESTDTTTAPNHRDAATPALGQGFFYLFRVSGGTYGSSSSGLPRVAGSGTCP